MSFRFVIGRAGTGKTTRCFNAIVDACAKQPLGGAAILWLVPKQATFTAERELACCSGLPAISRARVVSFEQLGRDILQECGGAAMPLVTSVGRQMVIGHLLREHRHKLSYFNTVAHHAGFAAELDSAFGEFERSGKSADDLAAAISAMDRTESAADSLAAKLQDLHLLFEAYNTFLGDERIDPHRRFERVLKCVEHSKKLRGASIYIDGFFDFTENERKLIASLAKVAGSIELTFRLDPNSPVFKNPDRLPEEMSVFNLTETTFRKLHFTLKEAGVAPLEAPVVLRHQFRSKNVHALQHLEHCFAANEFKPSAKTDGVSMIEAIDRRTEVDAVARQIQSLVADGFRYREIVVLVRKLDTYADLFDASFREHGLPWFMDRRRSASHHPLIRFIRALPAIAMHNWEHDALMSLLKSGLIPLGTQKTKSNKQIDREKSEDLFSGTARGAFDDWTHSKFPDDLFSDRDTAASRDPIARDKSATPIDQIDALENYVIDRRIRGDAWASDESWAFRGQLTRGDDDADPIAHGRSADDQLSLEMDALRRAAVAPLTPFVRAFAAGKAAPLKQLVAALFQVFDDCDIRGTLGGWMQQAADAGDLEQQAEHAQVWNELVDLLDQMVDLLGEQSISGPDFAAILDAGLESFDLAIAPPAVDQILIGSVDRTRTPSNVRACIVMGLHEGGFPFAPKESSIFGDSERATLRERDLSLDVESKRRLLDEKFYGYVAFTRSSERLILTRPTTDGDGRPLSPSSFWTMIRRALPGSATQTLRRADIESPRCIGTPRQLMTGLLKWARAFAEPGNGAADTSKPVERELETETAIWPALYQQLARQVDVPNPIAVLRKTAWPALTYQNIAELSPQVAHELFENELYGSVSRIEAFAACPFKHFAGFVLKLQRRDEPDVTALDLGNVYHDILENLVREMVARREDFATAPHHFTAAKIREYAIKVGEALRHELLLSNARNQYLLDHVQRTLDQVVDTHREQAKHGAFQPWRTELTFGRSVDPARNNIALPAFEMTTAQNHRIKLNGRIDRVDWIEERAAFAVIDYKLSDRALDLSSVYYGLSLQLLTYLLVLQGAGQTLAGRPLTPAAAFYVKLLRKIQSVDHPAEATETTDPKFHLQYKPRGIFNADFLNELDASLTVGKSNVVHAQILKGGEPGKLTDAAEPEQFAALIEFARLKLSQIGDQIISGAIDVAPYRIGNATPCARCDFNSVCRFDSSRESYRHFSKLGREQVIQLATDAVKRKQP